MNSHSEVLLDMTQLRSELLASGAAHRALLRLTPARALLDIGFDWLTILGSVAAVVWVESWLAPLVVIVVANRQRALGNILHDAGHRNLWRDRRRNDLAARLLVAPLLFASLSNYRAGHISHHMSLGDVSADPDFLPIPVNAPRRWRGSFAAQFFSASAWRGSFAGHLLAPGVSAASRVYIVAWWICALAAMLVMAGAAFTAVFVLLWLLARATVFHAITTFREMCDHFGLRPGGVLSFTRDMTCHGFWRALIHPRNNGYHLTHHLLPAVPYYRLPEAQALFCTSPLYRARAQVCRTYFSGPTAVTCDWQSPGRR